MSGTAPPGPPPGLTLPQSSAHADQMHGQMQGLFKKTSKSMGFADSARKALDKLVALGPAVEPDDVIEAVSDLVAKGLDPRAMAGLLGTMPPTGGEALAGWLEQQDQMLTAQTAQAKQAHEDVRHHLGVSAVHVMGDASMAAAGAPPGVSGDPGPTAPPSAPGNPLIPGV